MLFGAVLRHVVCSFRFFHLVFRYLMRRNHSLADFVFYRHLIGYINTVDDHILEGDLTFQLSQLIIDSSIKNFKITKSPY